MSRPLSPAARKRALLASGRLDDLAERSLAPWLAHGADPLGGVFGHLDRAFRPVFDEDHPRGPSGEMRGSKGLVQQARHLYAYSLYHRRRPDRAPACAAAAQRQFAVLQEVFARPDGTLVHMVDRQHRPLDDRVQLYAQGFAVFAFAEYGRAFDDAGATAHAKALFRHLDAARHDDAHGGYDQRDDGGWLEATGAPAGAAKCTNTHIHWLEALTTLCRCDARDDATGRFRADALVTERLRELALLLSRRLLQPSGYVHRYFTCDWRPVGAPEVSYGHDLETAWMLLDAGEVLLACGASNAAEVQSFRRAALELAEHALRTGWDPRGGVFDSGVPAGSPEAPRVLAFQKVWWAQAEALLALCHLLRWTGDERFLDAIERTLEFLTHTSWDPMHGEFFWSVSPEGCVGPRGDHKGELWKTPYHGLRAFVLGADLLSKQDDQRLHSRGVAD